MNDGLDFHWACVRCGDVVPALYLTEEERDEWMQRHTAQTGHRSWERREGVGVDD